VLVSATIITCVWSPAGGCDWRIGGWVVVTTVTFESIAFKDPTLTKVPPLTKLSFCSTKIVKNNIDV